MAKPIPSDAQAKLIMRVFSDWREHTVYPCYADPTTTACSKRGWLVATDKCGTAPNGTPSTVHVISDAGLDALEDWHRQRRYKRTPTPGGAG